MIQLASTCFSHILSWSFLLLIKKTFRTKSLNPLQNNLSTPGRASHLLILVPLSWKDLESCQIVVADYVIIIVFVLTLETSSFHIQNCMPTSSIVICSFSLEHLSFQIIQLASLLRRCHNFSGASFLLFSNGAPTKACAMVLVTNYFTTLVSFLILFCTQSQAALDLAKYH